jgi:small subunit ribosomal protein S9
MTKVIISSGKRKSSVARATIKKGKGTIKINKTALHAYQPEFVRNMIEEPLTMAEKHVTKLDIRVNVKGGGIISEAEAVRTAIAKGIVEYTGDAKLKEAYSTFDRTLLVSDIRYKEPKKQLGRGARKKRQKSYR